MRICDYFILMGDYYVLLKREAVMREEGRRCICIRVVGREAAGDKLEPMSLNLLTNSVVVDVTYSVVKSIIGANKASFSKTLEGGAETSSCV